MLYRRFTAVASRQRTSNCGPYIYIREVSECLSASAVCIERQNSQGRIECRMASHTKITKGRLLKVVARILRTANVARLPVLVWTSYSSANLETGPFGCWSLVRIGRVMVCRQVIRLVSSAA